MILEQLIGNTPLVEIRNLNPNPAVTIYCKLEGQNPGGSVKDRAAYGMISGALKRREIKEGDNLVEATSGNTGIALAMIAQSMKVNMTLVMPKTATPERVKTMRAYGAEVLLTEGNIVDSRQQAQEMADSGAYYMLNQFANPDNYGMHYRTTGPEIWADTKGRITHFVSAMGTTGTIMGVSRFLKEQRKDIQIIGTQPEEGSSIPGIRRWPQEMLPKIYQPKRVDRIIDVSRDQAIAVSRNMAKEEGILAGMSSGGSLYAAIKIAQELQEGIIVCITCDRGDRYLSSDLFL